MFLKPGEYYQKKPERFLLRKFYYKIDSYPNLSGFMFYVRPQRSQRPLMSDVQSPRSLRRSFMDKLHLPAC